MLNKKAISPVVATSLLLVVAVVAVVGFQGWYQTFSSNLFVEAEQDSGNLDTSGIEGIIGDTLYLKAGNNLTVTSIQIDGNDCNINGTFQGTTGIDVSECLSQITSSTPEIVMITDDKVLSKSVYLDDKTTSSLLYVAPQCYSAPVNTTGNWSGCQNMLIVNKSMLDNAVTNNPINSGEDFYIEYSGINYTFGNSQYNIFTGQITDMSSLFIFTNFNSNINYWDVSNVEYMGAMFWSATSFNQSLDKWDVSNVESMNSMFSDAFEFNQSLNNWDVSSVIDMSNMFSEAYEFNQPLNNWDVSSVTDMTNMFSEAYEFNQNISSWCVTNIGSKPTFFDGLSGFEDNTSLQPQWGTCP